MSKTKCVNPNYGYNKIVKEKYGLDAVYYLDSLLSNQRFIDWKGDASEPTITDDLVVFNNAGKSFDMNPALRDFYAKEKLRKRNAQLRIFDNNKTINIKEKEEKTEYQKEKESLIEKYKKLDEKYLEVESKVGSKLTEKTKFLKKELRPPTGTFSLGQLKSFARRLRLFNEKYGTAHQFKSTTVGVDTYNKLLILENWKDVDPFQSSIVFKKRVSSEISSNPVSDIELLNEAIDISKNGELNDGAISYDDQESLDYLYQNLIASTDEATSKFLELIKDKLKVNAIVLYDNDSAPKFFATKNDPAGYIADAISSNGFWDQSDNTIYLNITWINESPGEQALFLSTIIHELGHSATYDKIMNLKNGIGTTEELEIYKKLNDLISYIKTQPGFEVIYGNLYGLTNVAEFVSEIYANKGFALKLNEIYYKSENVLDKIFEFIAKLLGIQLNTAAYQGFYLASQIVEMSKREDSSASENNNVVKSERFTEITDQLNTLETKGKDYVDTVDGNGYVNKNDSSDTYIRTHPIIQRFNPDQEMIGENRFELMAKRLYRNRNKNIETDKISYPHEDKNEKTFEELIKYLEDSSKLPLLSGKITHEIIQNPDRYRSIKDVLDNQTFVEQANEIGFELKTLSYLFYNTIQNDDTSYTYLENLKFELGLIDDNLSTALGLGVSKIYNELRLVNKELGIGSTLDIVIARENGTLSMYELKTGSSLLKTGLDDNVIKKYAKKHGIKFTKLTEAQIQIMIGAMLLKIEIPTAKFSNIDVIYVNYRHLKSGFPARITTFDKQKILDLLGDYFKQNNPDFYSKNRSLFKYSNYGDISYELADEVNKLGLDNVNQLTSIYAEQVRQLTHTIELLKRGYTVDQDEKLYKSQQLIKLHKLSYSEAVNMRNELAKKILQIDSRGKVDVDAKANLSWLMKTFGNKRYISGGLLNRLRFFIERNRRAFEDERFNLYKKEQELFMPIYQKYLDENPTQKIAKGLTGDMLNLSVYKNMYSFMWEETDNGEYFVTESSSKWKDLTSDQKAYSRFIRISIMKEFYKTMHPQSLITILERRISSNLYDDETVSEYRNIIKEFSTLENRFINKLAGLTRFGHLIDEWDDTFAPRVPMGVSESFEHAKGIKGYLKITQESTKNSFMDPLEFINDDNNLMAGMKMKYMGSAKMIEDGSYTRNTSIAFFQYMSNVVSKRHMDQAYAVAKTFRDLHELSDNMTGEDFSNTAKFIDDVLINNLILQKPRKKEERIPAIHALRMITSLAYLGFRYTSGIKNAIFEILNNVRNAIAGSIIRKDVDFSLSDYTKAVGIWIGWKLKSWRGVHDNKMLNVMKRYKFDTDDLEYAVRKIDLIGGKNRVIDIGTTLKSHAFFETFTNQTAMIAQMIRNKTWERHDNKGMWIGEARAIAEGKEVTYLTYQEVERMRAVGEKLHGSYREDEKSSAEFSFLGYMAFQFHKFIPSYLYTMWSGKRGPINREELGKWIKTGEFTYENGKIVPIWEWESAVFQGEFWVTQKVSATFMLKMMRDMFAISSIRFDSEYQWSNLHPEQKRAMVSLMLRGVMWATLYMAIAAMFADTPDDDKWKKQFKGLPNDILGGLNIPDIGRIAKEPIISFGLMSEVLIGLQEFVFNGVIMGERIKTGKNKGNIKGTSRIKRAMPFYGSYLDSKEALFGKD